MKRCQTKRKSCTIVPQRNNQGTMALIPSFKRLPREGTIGPII
jgi:hypothetical protein